MLVPLSWLQTYAAFPNDVALLSAPLDDLGLVVESIERIGEGLEDICCAKVLDIQPIDGADKVREITVDAGDGPLGIVCGAWNFAVGDVVPLAPVGAVLPGGFAIAKRKMRGVTSNGMLCSAREIGLGADTGGLMLLTDLEGATPGRNVAELLGITADVVFELTAEGNRPDAWSIVGVAKDLSARLGLDFQIPTLCDSVSEQDVASPLHTASVITPSLCSHLTVTRARNIAVGTSPAWLERRLTLAGMRPISNVVDASNYVMLELGQPTHAYDFVKVAGAHLGVRTAHPSEQISTLDGVTRTLGNPGRGLGDSATDLVIVDGDDTVIGIAGLMGGASTEIDASTTELLLEAACFDAMTIARTSKKLGLRSEASSRFERGVDPELATVASRRFFEVLALSCPDLVVETPSVVAHGEVASRTVITASTERFGRLLGITLSGEEISNLLHPLGFSVDGVDDALQITVPSNRPDIRSMPFGIADVAEEIVRTYGYARLERRFPSWPTPGSLTHAQRLRRQLRDVLCGLGVDEVWTPTLVDVSDAVAIGLGSRAQVTLANPLAEQESALRSSLLPGMLSAFAYNADRRNEAARFFEIGTAFTHPTATTTPRMTRAGSGGTDEAALPQERTLLCVSLRGETDDAASAVATFTQLHRSLRLSDVELVQPLDRVDISPALMAGAHPTRSAAIRCTSSGVIYGVVGEVSPTVLQDFGLGSERRVGLLMVDVTALEVPGLIGRASLQARPISKFPSSDIDLAFTLSSDVPAGALREVLRAAASELCQSVELFDVYRGQGVPDGSRSLAFSLRFASLERTLTDAEVGAARANCISAAADLGAVLR